MPRAPRSEPRYPLAWPIVVGAEHTTPTILCPHAHRHFIPGDVYGAQQLQCVVELAAEEICQCRPLALPLALAAAGAPRVP